ncbi:MAG: protein kinase [Planctomycetaceae bacterium]|nr:protein kinase [Planctomycetaceae bacterium]
MNETDCPSSETLLAFALGKLTTTQADGVVRHLEECDDCRQIMESLSCFQSPVSPKHDDAAPESDFHADAGADVHAETDIRQSDPQETTAGPADGHVLLSALESGDRVSRYELTRLHASGGMGRVWLARDPAVGREVALKELLPQQADAPQIWARFMHEARVTGQLEHPGIVPVYEVNSGDSDKPFYTMRFVKGQTLHQAAKDFRQLRESQGDISKRLRELVSAVIGVSNAIAYAHSRGVLHRDLKGRNIVLGDFGEVIVLDWGLAGSIDGDQQADLPVIRSSDSKQTQVGQILGTPGFMAPEQAVGDPSLISSRTDVYGLGAVLYEVLTGGPPIQGNSSKDILYRVQHESPVDPRDVWPEISRPLEAVCLKAMAKDPGARYATPQAFAADLTSWLADEPVSVFTDPVLVRVGRWARGHRVLVASTVALLVTAVTALSIGTVAISREQQRTQTAKVQAEKNLRKAREAVDSMLSRVGHERLRNIPQMESLRRELLEEAARFHEEFLEDSGNADLQIEAARTQQRLGGIYRLLGRMDEAFDAMEESERILSGAAASGSQTAAFLRAEGLSQKAKLKLELGDHESAGDLAEHAVQAFPSALPSVFSPEQTVALATAWQTLATAQQRDGDAPASEASLRQAVAAYEQSTQPEHPDCQLGESQVRAQLAGHLFATDQHGPAELEYQRVIDSQTELSHAAPDNADITEALAESYRGYAVLLKTTDERGASLDTLQKSLEIHQRLARDFPQVIQYRRALTDCQTQLASVQAVLGDSPSAESTFLKAKTEAVILADEYPAILELQTSATASAEALGAFYASERRDEDSEAVLAEAATRLRSLSSQYKDSRDYRAELGRVLRGWSDVAGRNEKFELALQLADEYVRLLEQNASQSDARAEDRNELGRGYRQLSNHHQELGDVAAATKWLQRAVDVQRQLTVDHPDVGDYQRQLAASLSNLAGIHLQQAEFDVVHRLHDEALAIRQRLHAAEPDWTTAQLDLAWAHRFQARILTAEGRWDDADQAVNETMRLLEQLRKHDGVSDLYNQVGLAWLQRTQLLLAQDKLPAALTAIEQGIQAYRQELSENPQRLHATRGLYRFTRRKADIWIQLGRFSEACELIQSAEKLTLPQEWGNPFEIAILISRVLPLLETADELDDAERARQRQQLAELAVSNLRKALEFDCPPEELLSIRDELTALEFYAGFQQLMTELN